MIDPFLLHYTESLLGLDAERCNAAVDSVRGLGLPHVSCELCDRRDIDAVAASVLLIDGLRELEARGIERTKLLAKLRRDRDVWPTWAELTAASHLAKFVADGAEFTLERARGSGSHPDYWAKANADGEIFPFLPPASASEVSIEFKALGLSVDEAAFCARAKQTLHAMKPQSGFMTLHAPVDLTRTGVWITREQRRGGEAEARRLARKLPGHTAGLAGAVIVGQGSEDLYVRRLRARFAEAFEQLPDDHACWVAFHWSNGAPVDAISLALSQSDIPSNVQGVVLIGSAVAFPDPNIHNFLMWAPLPSSESGFIEFHSLLDDELARLVWDRIDRSAGVRACVIRGAVRGGGFVDLLTRDGTRTILPFNLLIDTDPLGAYEFATKRASPRKVHDR